MKIRIHWPSGQITAELKKTATSTKLEAVLPCESEANRWGKEVYFEIPCVSKLEKDAKEVVEPGTVCFWVEGKSLAIPFGPTPVSRGNECRLVTRVNVLGRVESDSSVLDSIKEGDLIRVEIA